MLIIAPLTQVVNWCACMVVLKTFTSTTVLRRLAILLIPYHDMAILMVTQISCLYHCPWLQPLALVDHRLFQLLQLARRTR